MGIDFFVIAVGLLFAFAIFDLIVGVSNDAVNFLNSSLGSRVTSRFVIMSIASLGILFGVTFSSGMMEVARKGIFHPQFFTMPELITLFLAVMITDILLLDLFNTYGLPTSTTVSIVFELLGGAVAVSVLKIIQSDSGMQTLSQYINTSSAMIIIFGILSSVAISFIFGALVQFLSRLLFTFDYMSRVKKFGAVWGGFALSMITYFILVKGAKGAVFITPEMAESIKQNAFVLIFAIFAVSALILQILILMKINIFKPIVLIGTFALAMAFAANDLVNFIGVPMAGYHAFMSANASTSPLTATMDALGAKVPTESYMLVIAGLIMVAALWISKKARSVTETEISLGEQSEGNEKFESICISKVVVGTVIGFFNIVSSLAPPQLRKLVSNRMDTSKYKADTNAENRPAFDLLRASVNMMVASAVISYATSHKLPLSTTYVTFMVAMGTSFSDLAWGRESAVYRVSGVVTVITGWFITAFMAFTVCGIIATALFFGGAYSVVGVIIVAALIIWRNRSVFRARAKIKEKDLIFNLKKVSDVDETVYTTFEHMAIFMNEIRDSLSLILTGLYNQNEYMLKNERKKIKRIQRWANVIIANVFKAMRLLEKKDALLSHQYGQTIRRIQKLANGHRDIAYRAHEHVSNHHKGLLDQQVIELKEIMQILDESFDNVINSLEKRDVTKIDTVTEKNRMLRSLAEDFNTRQVERIQNRDSKTRLSILFYSIVGNAIMMSKQNMKLLANFAEAFGKIENAIEPAEMES